MSHPSVGKRRLWTATGRQPSQRNLSNVVSCTVRKSVVGLTENVRTTRRTRYRISLDRDARNVKGRRITNRIC
jgi:hypothetical protein